MKEPTCQRQTLYPQWDLTAPALPPRSRLYSLAPIGVGTPAVESLTSFLMRLAAAHCVATGTLFAQEMVPRMNCAYLRKSATEPVGHALHLVKQIHTVNGCGPTSSQWVGALESLTGQDHLQRLTMLPWKNVLAPRALLRQTRTWCPVCLAERRDQHEPVYEWLSWTLASVTVCLRHDRGLVDRCPHCGQSSPLLTPKAVPGYCFRCCQWLGTPLPTRAREQAQPDAALTGPWQKARLVGEMVALAPTLPLFFSRQDFASRLNQYAEQLTAGNVAAFARFLGLDYLMVRALRYGVNHPLLEVFLTLLLRLQLSVPEFLNGTEAEIALPDRSGFPLPSRIAAARELMRAARSDPTCPSVRELTSRVGYKQEGNLRQADPALCKELSARHRQVRPSAPHTHQRRYDEPTLREKLTAALQEHPAPPLQQLAERLGYKSAQTLQRRCPELCAQLQARRKADLQGKKEVLEQQLKMVLTEEPPPSLRAVARRWAYQNEGQNEGHLSYSFPDLARAITDRHRAYRKTARAEGKIALETALTQVPPPSLRQVARTTHQSLASLQQHYPELCRQVAARRLYSLHQRADQKREQRKAEIKQVVLRLQAQGIYPSSYRVKQAAAHGNILRADWARAYYDELMREISRTQQAETP